MERDFTKQKNSKPEGYAAFYRFIAWAMLGWLVWAALVTSGCASTRAASEEKIKHLEREVQRLTAERANLDARARSLDDKLVVLKNKLGKCDRVLKPGLEVVRLTPTETHVEPEIEEEPIVTSSPEKETLIAENDKRPRLTLYEGGPRFSSRPAASEAGRRAVELSDTSAFAALGAENLGVVSNSKESTAVPGAMDAFNEAYLSYSNKQYDEALNAFSRFIQSNPSHAFADDALYWRGECYLAKGRFLKAIGEFERLGKRYPDSEKVPSGLYRIGFVYDKLKDFRTAVRYYFEVVEKYPGTDAARRAGSRVQEIQNRPSGGAIPTAVTR
jgi:tol-pal system protein YbgF